MKILKKRIIAFLIDCFLIGILGGALQYVLRKNGIYLDYLVFALMIVLLLFKDTLCVNASIGKKIMGISIYTLAWQKPRLPVILKRTLCVITVVYLLCWKAFFVSGDFIAIFDCERERAGTFAIDKKVYKKLKEGATENGSFSAEKMTALYKEYLSDIYSK